MAEVKWIKVVTDMFDDEKIRYIETMPNGDEIIVIWFKILCLAGKSNSNGLLMMTDKIAYTEEMLSSVFNRDIKIIHCALTVFENLNMLEILEDKFYLPNWEKHQNTDKLETIREQTKKRMKKYREKLSCYANSVTVTQQLRNGYATDIESIDKDIDNKKERLEKKGNLSHGIEWFLGLHTNIILANYSGLITDMDFEQIDKEITVSTYLRGITSFTWIQKNYEKIIEGFYRDRKDGKSQNNGGKFTAEEIKRVEDSLEMNF